MLPLSIGDGELCETALTTVSVPEMFHYWLQGGRITVGFLGGAQVDRFGNLNSTVIGDYAQPKVRLPGSGGATEIATSCRQIFIVMRHNPARVRREARFSDLARPRTRPAASDANSVSEPRGRRCWSRDLCTMRPNAETKEFEVVSLHPGVTRSRCSERRGGRCASRRTVERNAGADRDGTRGAARSECPHGTRARHGAPSSVRANEDSI